MKSIMILLAFLLTLMACKKDNDEFKAITKKDIIGKWVNLAKKRDTLEFSDSILGRRPLSKVDNLYFYWHWYKYTLSQSDSLELFYKGYDKIHFIYPFVHKIKLNVGKDTLQILYMHKTYPYYEGDIFTRISKPNI